MKTKSYTTNAVNSNIRIEGKYIKPTDLGLKFFMIELYILRNK